MPSYAPGSHSVVLTGELHGTFAVCEDRQHLTVVELSDGTAQARHVGKLLPLTRFGKDDAEITPGAIVSNQLLAGPRN